MKTLFTISIFLLMGLIRPVSLSAQVVIWDGGAGTSSWFDANNWDTNAIPTASDTVQINLTTDVVVIPVSSPTQTAVAKILSNFGTLTIDNMAMLVVDSSDGVGIYNAGDFINNGEVSISNTVSDGIFNTSNDANFENNNVLIISNVGSDGIENSNRATFTNNQQLTITTTGDSGFNNVTPFFFDPGTTIFNNAGTLDISNTVDHGMINNGIRRNFDFGRVSINNSGIINMVVSIGINGINNQDEATLTNDAGAIVNIRNTGNSAISLSGSSSDSFQSSKVINSGTINMDENISGAGVICSSESHFSNLVGGEIYIKQTTSHGISASGSSFNFASAVFINQGLLEITDGIGSIGLSCQSYGRFTNEITGNLLIENTTSNGISISGSGGFAQNYGSITIQNGIGNHGLNNSGSLFINYEGAVLNIQNTVGSAIFNSGSINSAQTTNNGEINILADITSYGIRMSGRSNIKNDTTGIISISGTGNAAIYNSGSSSNGNSVTFTNHGSISTNGNIDGDGILNSGRVFFTNSEVGILNLSNVNGHGIRAFGSSFQSDITTFTNEGEITISNSGTSLDPKNGINNGIRANFTNRSTGQITVSSSTDHGVLNRSTSSTYSANFINEGALTIVFPNGDGFSNQNKAILQNQSGSLLQVAFPSNRMLSNLNGATVSGTGLFFDFSSKQLLNEANWEPGNSPGTITIDGDANFSSASSSYNAELETAADYDQTIIDGDLMLGGDLNITLLNGFIPDPTDQFILFDVSGTTTGTFANVNLPASMSDWLVDYTTPSLIYLRMRNPLPVELVIFTTQVMDNRWVQLNWNTESETNNSHFELERSQNGFDFEKFGSVQGSGTSSMPHQYDFVDDQPFQAISYYRLKQVDLDGGFEYSDVRTVIVNSEISMTLYPNPVRDRLNIRTNQEIITITIYNEMGSKVYYDHAILQNELDVSQLASGLYQIVIATASKSFQQTIFKL